VNKSSAVFNFSETDAREWTDETLWMNAKVPEARRSASVPLVANAVKTTGSGGQL
jgi:hypothetical protein